VHHERDGWRELVERSTVQRGELVAFQLEVDDHHGPGRAGALFAVAQGAGDPGVLEDRRVEPGGLLRLSIEPKEWGDLGAHFFSFFWLGRSISRKRRTASVCSKSSSSKSWRTSI